MRRSAFVIIISLCGDDIILEQPKLLFFSTGSSLSLSALKHRGRAPKPTIGMPGPIPGHEGKLDDVGRVSLPFLESMTFWLHLRQLLHILLENEVLQAHLPCR